MYDEYGELLSVIIGLPNFAMLPSFDDSVIIKNQITSFIPFFNLENKLKIYDEVYKKIPILNFVAPKTSSYYNDYLIQEALKESNNLQYILEKRGIKCYRPDPKQLLNINKHHECWDTTCHFNCNNPRDVFFTYDDYIIETPMAERSRYYESQCYNLIIKDIKPKHLIMPKSKMLDSLYTDEKYVTNNTDICMDAADCLKLGKHLFIQRSIVTNDVAITYLKELLKPKGIEVHKLLFHDDTPHHIDATLNTIKPGIFIENPTTPMHSKLKKEFEQNGWKFYQVPQSTQNDTLLCSSWLNMNYLQIDEKTIIIEESEKPTIKFLESLGMKCIPIPYKNNYIFGGGLHCTTLDIERANQSKQSYNLKLSF